MKTYIEDIEFDVTYTYSKGSNGCHTTNTGDPGWPAEPATIDDIRLIADFGGELKGIKFEVDFYNLPEKIRDRIENEIYVFEDEKRDNAIAEQYEREYDERMES